MVLVEESHKVERVVDGRVALARRRAATSTCTYARHRARALTRVWQRLVDASRACNRAEWINMHSFCALSVILIMWP